MVTELTIHTVGHPARARPVLQIPVGSGCAMEDFDKRLTVRGGVALLAALVINRFGVVLMRYSGSGSPAISSMPYALTAVCPARSMGT